MSGKLNLKNKEVTDLTKCKDLDAHIYLNNIGDKIVNALLVFLCSSSPINESNPKYHYSLARYSLVKGVLT